MGTNTAKSDPTFIKIGVKIAEKWNPLERSVQKAAELRLSMPTRKGNDESTATKVCPTKEGEMSHTVTSRELVRQVPKNSRLLPSVCF